MTTLELANDALRHAVETRLAGTNPSELDVSDDERKTTQDSLQPLCCEGRKFYGHEGSENYAEWAPAFQQKTPAHETLEHAIAAVLDRHGRYGPPTEHFGRTAALVNAAFGTTFTPADWALVMVLDKVARQRGPAATDDAAIDIAGYAACHQECRQNQ